MEDFEVGLRRDVDSAACLAPSSVSKARAIHERFQSAALSGCSLLGMHCRNCVMPSERFAKGFSWGWGEGRVRRRLRFTQMYLNLFEGVGDVCWGRAWGGLMERVV